MTGLEITLLLVGIVFMVGSFLITERLSGSELNKVSELSEDEIRRILERELTSAQQKIDTQIEQSIVNSIEQSSDRVDRALDKETNEKIMAISEFSDTVMENMNKTHNEIMFLYSMLNDKHATMTEHMEELQKLLSEIDQKKETQDTDLAAALAKFEEHIKEREEELSRKWKQRRRLHRGGQRVSGGKSGRAGSRTAAAGSGRNKRRADRRSTGRRSRTGSGRKRRNGAAGEQSQCSDLRASQTGSV